mgnify:CR=1 FL=1
MDLNKIQYDQQETPFGSRGKPITYDGGGKVISFHYDKKWDFGAIETKAVGKKAIVSFEKTNLIYRRGIQDTLYDLYSFYKEKDILAPTASQLSSWKLGLQHISNSLGSTDWSSVEDRQTFRQFKKKLKQAELSKCLIEYNVTNALSRLHEASVINSLIDRAELVALAKPKVVKQHIAIPIGMYERLLSHAIGIVETYYPHRDEIARVMEEAYDIKKRIERGENLIKGHKRGSPNDQLSMTRGAIESRVTKTCSRLISHDIPSFVVELEGKQLGQVQMACILVTLGFSGVRIGESVSFNQNSYGTKIVDSDKVISVLTGKTSKGNDGRPKTETWQSHFIVKDALELAQTMTEPLRQQYRKKIEYLYDSGEYRDDQFQKALTEVASAFIPLKPSVQKNTYTSSNTARQITQLMKVWDIRATPEDVEEFDLLNPSREGELKLGGHLPKLTPHDFRRTFAVFFKRYGFGTATGIKFQYKHENINMSDYYANNAQLMHMHDVLMDVELILLMEEEGIKLGVDIYDDIYNSSEQLSGKGGERIAQDKFKKMKSGQHVYMARKEIEMLVRNGSLAAVQLPTGGYCINPECDRVCGMGLFIAEKKQCIHQVNTDKSAKQMAQQRKRLVKQFRGINNGDTLRSGILIGIKQKIKEIEITLNKHQMKYEPFCDQIEGVIYG